MTGAPRDKIRHTSWTWGRYVLNGDGHSLGDEGFDYYDDARHACSRGCERCAGGHSDPACRRRCDRCSYDDAVPGEVPEYFANLFDVLCDECRRHLARLQFRQSDWGEH